MRIGSSLQREMLDCRGSVHVPTDPILILPPPSDVPPEDVLRKVWASTCLYCNERIHGVEIAEPTDTTERIIYDLGKGRVWFAEPKSIVIQEHP